MFRASGLLAQRAFDSIRAQAVGTKAFMQLKRAQFVLATSGADHAIAVVAHCAQALPLLAQWAATPGLAAYAQAQTNDPAYDVVAEYTAMRNSIVSLRDQLMALFPKDANGFLLYETFLADGTRQARAFTAAQLQPVVTLIDAVIATID